MARRFNCVGKVKREDVALLGDVLATVEDIDPSEEDAINKIIKVLKKCAVR